MIRVLCIDQESHWKNPVSMVLRYRKEEEIPLIVLKVVRLEKEAGGERDLV